MTRLHPSRRHFLQGAGVAMSLPFLDSLSPAFAAGRSQPPVRIGWLFFPNGVVKEDWAVTGDGRDFTFGKSNACLEAVGDNVLMISGLAQKKKIEGATTEKDAAGAHALGSARFLTCKTARKTNGKDIYLGISADQVAAKQIGNQTRLSSIELGNEVGKQEGRCDNGYSCTYLSNISWRSPTQPCGVEINPRRAFDRLFGLQGKEAVSMKARASRRKSVLDFVADDARSLSRKVSGSDHRKLTEYYESVRELEIYIDRTSSMPPLNMPLGLRPEATPETVVHHMRMMYDIMALAFQTDATRVITNMLADGQTSRVYEHLGLTSGHHQLTHSNGLDAEIQRIDQFMTEEFARFVGKLKSIPEGDGTLLDNCMIMFGSGLGDGRKHNHDDLPCVIAGGGGGSIQTGRHLVTPKDTPIANLYLAMIQSAGGVVSQFADSDGPLAGLKDW